jgi:predicted nucleic acid-binding protein
MESLICLDASVLINHYREKNKQETFFYHLIKRYESFNISVITEYEILIGAKAESQVNYWKNIFADCFIVNYTSAINQKALEVSFQLFSKKLTIEFKDPKTASTALHHKLPLATMNKKHFINIEKLKLITPDSFQ